ncbi:hypothetical protein B0H21DRAFT_827310 [Amylocystis lapponica]|nr:hypothetical protein B0H21DRAFT_827310 [Amylocystis lapponica]
MRTQRMPDVVHFCANPFSRKFPELLHRSTLNIDNDNRGVSHHIIDVALSEGKTHTAHYDMKTALRRLAVLRTIHKSSSRTKLFCNINTAYPSSDAVLHLSFALTNGDWPEAMKQMPGVFKDYAVAYLVEQQAERDQQDPNGNTDATARSRGFHPLRLDKRMAHFASTCIAQRC